MSGIKWKKVKVFKYAVGVLLVGMLVCGCGKEEATVTEETTAEVMDEVAQEETTVAENETTNQMVVDSNDKETNIQESEQGPDNLEVWESVKEKNDICIVAINERTGSQSVMYSKGSGGENTVSYIIQEGDKIFIPLRDNIRDIFFYYSGDTNEAKTLYSIESDPQNYSIVEIDNALSAIEVKDFENKDYNIMINISESGGEYVYFLVGYYNQ